MIRQVEDLDAELGVARPVSRNRLLADASTLTMPGPISELRATVP